MTLEQNGFIFGYCSDKSKFGSDESIIKKHKFKICFNHRLEKCRECRDIIFNTRCDKCKTAKFPCNKCTNKNEKSLFEERERMVKENITYGKLVISDSTGQYVSFVKEIVPIL